MATSEKTRFKRRWFLTKGASRKPHEPSNSPEKVMRCWNRGEAINVIHEVMREDSIIEILRYIHIALLCIDGNAETRPSIDKVLHWFSCFSTPLPEPTIGNRFLAEEEQIDHGRRLYLPVIALLRHPYPHVKEIEYDRIRLALLECYVY